MKKIFLIGTLIAILAATATGYWIYQSIYKTQQLWSKADISHKDIYITKNTGFPEWQQMLIDSFPEMDEFWFKTLSNRMNLKAHIYPGRYRIPQEMSLLELNKKFRSGAQDPVMVVVPMKWTLDDLAAHVSGQLEADSADIINALLELNENAGQTPHIPFYFVIPNTYEFYWNTDGRGFAVRMKKESEKFWNQNQRLQKAAKLQLSPEEVYTLASIVCRETAVSEEMPDIAGVYLNRIRNGIALQADPTVKFAVGDLALRRILHKHLEYDSPFNTYKYPGLPPGPISLADIQSIDAVLNAREHNYLYFCAKPDSSGRHNFSSDYRSHLANARKFHQWLNSRNIR